MITSFNVWEISRNKSSIIINELVCAFCIQFLNWTFQGMQKGIWQKTNKQETEFSVQNYTVCAHILSVWEGQLRRMRNRNERSWGSFNNVCASVGRCSVLDGFSLQNITSWNILSLTDSYTPGFFFILHWHIQLDAAMKCTVVFNKWASKRDLPMKNLYCKSHNSAYSPFHPLRDGMKSFSACPLFIICTAIALLKLENIVWGEKSACLGNYLTILRSST